MESRTKNKQTREQIARMAARAFPGVGVADGDDAVVELTEGWFNAAYVVRLADGRRTVLKIAPPPDAEVMTYERDLLTTEVDCMRLAAADPAIPVPAVLFHEGPGDLCDAGWFFMEHIDGVGLNHARPTLAPEAVERIEEQTGLALRALNGLTGPWFGYPGNPDLRAAAWRTAFLGIVESLLTDGAGKAVDYRCDADEIRGLVTRHAGALDEVTTPCLVHWDAWDPNILARDGELVGLLDFERCLWADPLMEAHFRPFSGDAVTPTMRGYGKTSLSPSEQRRSQLYTLHLGLVIVTECSYRNYDDDHVLVLGHRILRGAMDWLTSH